MHAQGGAAHSDVFEWFTHVALEVDHTSKLEERGKETDRLDALPATSLLVA